MADYYRPCLKTATSSVYLPLPILSWNETPVIKHGFQDVPMVGGATPLWSKDGMWKISIAGKLQALTTTGGVYTYANGFSAAGGNALKTALLSLHLSTFDLYRWHNYGFADCVMAGLSFRESHRAFRVIDYTLEILCTSPGDNAALDTLDDASPWETFAGSPETGGTVIVPVDDYQISHINFPGVIAVTSSGQDKMVIVSGPPSSSVYVIGIGVLGCSGRVPGSDGDTTIEVSTASIGAEVTGLSVTINETQADNYAAAVGAIEVAIGADGTNQGGDNAGTPLYVYATEADGGHTDLQAYLHISTTDRTA